MKPLFVLYAILFFIACAPAKKEQITYDVGQIKTPIGEMLFALSDLTPNHKASFIKLANEHYWDTLTFNRVIKDFVIQGGCPDTPEGFSKSPYLLKPELHNKAGIPRLDGNFMIIGQVFKGLEVLDSIGLVATDTLDKPLVPVTLLVNVLKMTEEELKDKGYNIPKLK